MRKQFPENFYWGTATSSHQVEGGNNNSWSEWEKKAGKIADGSVSGAACDHFNRYESDLDDLKKMNTNAYRFSLEWSRCEPLPGMWNDAAFDHYRDVVKACRQRGLEPFVTLHHFTNPIWFENMGGFLHHESPLMFERFVVRAAEALGEMVTFWITINEPVVYTLVSCLLGKWPPGKKNFFTAKKVIRNLLLAHRNAYHALHAMNHGVKAGIAKSIIIFDPVNPESRRDVKKARMFRHIFDESVIDALATGILPKPLGTGKPVSGLKGTVDFMGLNYYTRLLVRFDITKPLFLFTGQMVNPDAETNNLGWEIYPEGMYRSLMWLHDYNLPIFVTENGTTVDDDTVRVKYVQDHLNAVHRAIDHGVDVRGYFYWSAIDNFEWAEGYTARFGLIENDFSTQKRTWRHSARVFAEICKNNAMP